MILFFSLNRAKDDLEMSMRIDEIPLSRESVIRTPSENVPIMTRPGFQSQTSFQSSRTSNMRSGSDNNTYIVHHKDSNLAHQGYGPGHQDRLENCMEKHLICRSSFKNSNAIKAMASFRVTFSWKPIPELIPKPDLARVKTMSKPSRDFSGLPGSV